MRGVVQADGIHDVTLNAYYVQVGGRVRSIFCSLILLWSTSYGDESWPEPPIP